jgi:hypothetical protein
MDIETSEFDVVMLCDHFGRRTTFYIRSHYMHTDHFEEDFEHSETFIYTTWYIMQCSGCSKPAVTQVTKSSKLVSPRQWKDSLPSVDVLYPTGKTPLTNLPEVIEKKYAEALRVSNISPSSCAVLVRKTLEAVCKHENAPGRVLADKLKNLADTGRIPQTLVDVALHLRQLGNLGAHFDEDEVTETDVLIILDFVELLLEYLYVAPAKIEAVKQRLNKQK